MNTTNINLTNLDQEEKEAFAAMEIGMLRKEWIQRDADLVKAELEVLFLSIDLSTAALNVLV